MNALSAPNQQAIDLLLHFLGAERARLCPNWQYLTSINSDNGLDMETISNFKDRASEIQEITRRSLCKSLKVSRIRFRHRNKNGTVKLKIQAESGYKKKEKAKNLLLQRLHKTNNLN